MTCLQCQAFAHIPITTPQALIKAISALKIATQKKQLHVVGRGSCMSDPFHILCQNTWNDFVENYFMCSTCQQYFKLFAETYHGSGGALTAMAQLPKDMIPESYSHSP